MARHHAVRALTIVLLVGGTCGPAVAGIVPIDSFGQPNPAVADVITLTEPDPFNVVQLDAGAIGGQRELTVDVQGAPSLISAAILVGEGSLKINTATPGSIVSLLYDGMVAPVDLTDGGTNNTILLAFDTTDAGPNANQFGIQIDVVSTSGTASFTGSVIEDSAPQSFFADFAAFVPVGGFSFTEVTSIEFNFNTPSTLKDVDFELNSIAAVVPEPASGVLALCGALGLGAVAGRRRRVPRH